MEIKKKAITPKDRDFTVVRSSPIQGRGLFAKKNIPKGTRIAEYTGKRVPMTSLLTDLEEGVTTLKYLMSVNDTTVIDGEREGNDMRFINHSCEPNCIVYYFDNIPYIYALAEIPMNAELGFDYHMCGSKDEVLNQQTKQQLMPCYCGSSNCKGTLLAD